MNPRCVGFAPGVGLSRTPPDTPSDTPLDTPVGTLPDTLPNLCGRRADRASRYHRRDPR